MILIVGNYKSRTWFNINFKKMKCLLKNIKVEE